MDEDKRPQIRKPYVEVREDGRIKRKRLASAMSLEEANQNAAVRIGQERCTIGTSGQVFISAEQGQGKNRHGYRRWENYQEKDEGKARITYGEVHAHQLKLLFHDTGDKSKSQKQGEMNVVLQQKLSLQRPMLGLLANRANCR